MLLCRLEVVKRERQQRACVGEDTSTWQVKVTITLPTIQKPAKHVLGTLLKQAKNPNNISTKKSQCNNRGSPLQPRTGWASTARRRKVAARTTPGHPRCTLASRRSESGVLTAVRKAGSSGGVGQHAYGRRSRARVGSQRSTVFRSPEGCMSWVAARVYRARQRKGMLGGPCVGGLGDVWHAKHSCDGALRCIDHDRRGGRVMRRGVKPIFASHFPAAHRAAMSVHTYHARYEATTSY